MDHLRVVCAIIEKDGRILAAKRGPAQSHSGFWEFPGGKINDNEDSKDAIVREIHEELGLDIAVMNRQASATFAYPDKTVTLIPFLCEIESGSPVLLEHDEIRWIDKDESLSLPWLPPDVVIAQKYWKQQSVRK